jgi:XTP/dITP diphosphohydrolase
MKPLLIATTNEGKLREIRDVLRGLDIPLLSLNDFPPVQEPDETESTFEGNALLKAHAYAQAFGVMTAAEDSGLVIDALGGAPGVHSARYPGDTYPEKFSNLYSHLAAQPRPWTARYVCAVAVVVKGDTTPLFQTTATVEGEIWPEPKGNGGFGYDPIFYYPPYGRTFGEVDEARKLAVAHRGKAFGRLKEWLGSGEYPAIRS